MILKKVDQNIIGYFDNSCYNVLCFWSMSCSFCVDNMPKLRKLKQKFNKINLIYIHRPMSNNDLDKNQIKEIENLMSVCRESIMDDDHKIGDELGVDAWPTYFLIDADGTVRRHARGQFGIKMIEQALIRLLGESDSATI